MILFHGTILFWNSKSYKFTEKNKVIMTKENINKYLVNKAVDKMTEYLIQDYKIGIDQAIDFIYNSDRTGLYIQSPAYIYQFLDKEYKTGTFC